MKRLVSLFLVLCLLCAHCAAMASGLPEISGGEAAKDDLPNADSFPGIAVTFYRRPDGKLVGYRAKGHSGYAEAGADIVCAAVSALTQTTLNGLKAVLKAPLKSEIDDQAAILEARLAPEATENQLRQAQLLLETLLQGLQSIEWSYPQNVRIYFEELR